jgi:hypothetical protein
MNIHCTYDLLYCHKKLVVDDTTLFFWQMDIRNYLFV